MNEKYFRDVQIGVKEDGSSIYAGQLLDENQALQEERDQWKFLYQEHGLTWKRELDEARKERLDYQTWVVNAHRAESQAQAKEIEQLKQEIGTYKAWQPNAWDNAQELQALREEHARYKEERDKACEIIDRTSDLLRHDAPAYRMMQDFLKSTLIGNQEEGI